MVSAHCHSAHLVIAASFYCTCVHQQYGDIRHAVDYIRNPLIKDVDQVSTDSLATVLTAAAAADISAKVSQ
jgi:hypothetical protein